MKKDFKAVEIEVVLFSTDIISTSPGDDGGFWLPTDPTSVVDISLGS